MKQIKHFTNAQDKIFASVVVDSQYHMLSCLWRAEALAAGQIDDVTEYCAQSIQTLKLHYWLNDVTCIQSPFHTHSAEAQKSALDRLHDTPLKKFALVSQREANPSRSALIHALKQCGVEIRTFKNIVLASEWLLLSSLEDDAWDKCDALAY